MPSSACSAASLDELPAGADVGTASLRRQAQTLFVRPDLGVVTMRGNVDTRLRKLEAGEADATFLALAGLKRLGLAGKPAAWSIPTRCRRRRAKARLAITTRADDARTRDALQGFENAHARIAIEAERAFLAALDGSCRTPIAALARIAGGELRFIGEALTPDGTARWRRVETIKISENAQETARTLGARLGHDIRAEAGDAIVMENDT